MKKYALLLLPFFLAACQESTEPADVPNTSKLMVTNDAMHLDRTMHGDSSMVRLECGCHFTFSVEKFSGDTNVIHYTKRDATTPSAYQVALDVHADTLAAVGTYNASIAVLSTGAKGTYRDTISVTYIRN